MPKSTQKSLAQIAYEADKEHTHIDFWGPWEKAAEWVKSVYRTEAAAVAREVRRREKQGKEHGARRYH